MLSNCTMNLNEIEYVQYTKIRSKCNLIQNDLEFIKMFNYQPKYFKKYKPFINFIIRHHFFIIIYLYVYYTQDFYQSIQMYQNFQKKKKINKY